MAEPFPEAEPAPEQGPVPEPEPRVDAGRLLAVADGPPLAPEEPDEADRRPLLPLELLAWDGTDRLVGLRCSDAVVLRSGRPPVRRTLEVTRITRWARAGSLTLHVADGADVEVRVLAPEEYAGVSIGDARPSRVPGPVRVARSGRLSGRRDDVGRALVARVLRLAPAVQVGNQ